MSPQHLVSQGFFRSSSGPSFHLAQSSASIMCEEHTHDTWGPPILVVLTHTFSFCTVDRFLGRHFLVLP